MISKKHLEKFKKIYKNKFGKELSDQEAFERGLKLLRLIKAVYKPMTKEEYERFSKRIQKEK